MILLSQSEIDFLLRVLVLPSNISEILEQAREKGGRLEDGAADTLRDLCGERLQTHGFGRSYEPNEEGRQLERVIDKLFIG